MACHIERWSREIRPSIHLTFIYRRQRAIALSLVLSLLRILSFVSFVHAPYRQLALSVIMSMFVFLYIYMNTIIISHI